MPKKPTIPSICLQCGKDFLALSDNVKKGYGKFCSRACRGATQTKDAENTLGYRLLSKVTGQGTCWRFTGALNNRGYGIIYLGGRMKLAHRVAYELFVGPVPEGKQLDHLCRNRWCINPQHLQPVTNRENFLRGEHPHAELHRSGMCKRGHAMTPENSRPRADGTGVECRACCHARAKERTARRQQARQGATVAQARHGSPVLEPRPLRQIGGGE